MRIMHVLKHSARGNGNVHVAVDLACRQSDTGDDVALVSSYGEFDAVLTAHGVRVLTIPEARGVRGGLDGGRALLALARRFRPDLLHAHMMSSAVLGFAVSKILRIPLVTTVHNSFDSHSRLMRLGTVVVAVSEAERSLLLSRGYPGRKVVTVLNGADGSPREALPSEPRGPLQRPCVAVLSGLHPRKAVHDVISAFAQVTGEHPDWHLNIIGWGPDRERLEASVRERGLDASVHFLGSVPAPRPLLEQADIFATATLADPCPLTVGEARAAGRAIVATAVGGIPELLDHGRAGMLSPAGDPSAMAANLRTLMADPDELRAWQHRSREGAEYLTVARMTADYGRVYRGVLAC